MTAVTIGRAALREPHWPAIQASCDEDRKDAMKAVQITSHDGPQGLRFAEFTTPAPGPGQVAITVAFAGVGFIDALLAEGFGAHRLPWVPGIEASGTVRALGEGVTSLAVGQPVAALTMPDGGGYGQVAVTRADLVAPLPPGMDPELAAVTPVNTTTALMSLERVARVRPGDRVLVHAAVGGLGSQFGQIARLLGASQVVGVVGTDAKREAALSLGYDEALLRSDLGQLEPRRFDVIVDPVGGPARLPSLKLLGLGGRLLIVGDAAQAGDQAIGSDSLWLDSVSALGFNLGAYAPARPALVGTYLRRALRLVAGGEVTVPISARVPARDAPQAMAQVRSDSIIGKALLVHEPFAG